MIVGILGNSGTGKDTMANYLCETHRLVKVAFADPMKRFCQKIFGFSNQQLWGESDFRNAVDDRFFSALSMHSTLKTARDRMWVHGPAFIDEMLPHFGHLEKRKALTTLWSWFDACIERPDFSARFALQTLGTEWGRENDPDVWARHTFEVTIPGIMSRQYLYTQDGGLFRRTTPAKLALIVLGEPAGVAISDLRFPNEVTISRSNNAFLVRLRRAGKGGDIKNGVANHRSETLQQGIPDALLDRVLDVPEGLPAYYRAIDTLIKDVPRSKRRYRHAA